MTYMMARLVALAMLMGVATALTPTLLTGVGANPVYSGWDELPSYVECDYLAATERNCGATGPMEGPAPLKFTGLADPLRALLNEAHLHSLRSEPFVEPPVSRDIEICPGAVVRSAW